MSYKAASALLIACHLGLPFHAYAGRPPTTLERPTWVDTHPTTQLCEVRSTAARLRDKAAMDSKHLEYQLQELEELQKGAKSSEGTRRQVLAIVGAYLAAGAVFGALGSSSASTVAGASATRVVIGAASSLMNACQDLIALAASGATFISTATIVTALGTWLSNASLEKLNHRGSPAQQVEHEERLKRIEEAKLKLQYADSELAAYTPETASTLVSVNTLKTPDQSARYMHRGLQRLGAYHNALNHLMAQVGADTDYLQSLIEDYCDEHTLLCASGMGSSWNASTHLELQVSLVRDRLLKNTALAVRAGQLAAATEVLLVATLGDRDPQSACRN